MMQIYSEWLILTNQIICFITYFEGVIGLLTTIRKYYFVVIQNDNKC